MGRSQRLVQPTDFLNVVVVKVHGHPSQTILEALDISIGVFIDRSTAAFSEALVKGIVNNYVVGAKDFNDAALGVGFLRRQAYLDDDVVIKKHRQPSGYRLGDSEPHHRRQGLRFLARPLRLAENFQRIRFAALSYHQAAINGGTPLPLPRMPRRLFGGWSLSAGIQSGL